MTTRTTAYFQANYPDWEPTDTGGSLYLTRMSEFQSQKKRARTDVGPVRLNEYGVPAVESSNLGDSFVVRRTTWQPPVEEEEEEEDEGQAPKAPQQVPRVLGLLNEFYDLNNAPRV